MIILGNWLKLFPMGVRKLHLYAETGLETNELQDQVSCIYLMLDNDCLI